MTAPTGSTGQDAARMATPKVTVAQATSGRRVRASSGSVASAVTSPLAARSGITGPVQLSTCW
jgi:hypothetical protein